MLKLTCIQVPALVALHISVRGGAPPPAGITAYYYRVSTNLIARTILRHGCPCYHTFSLSLLVHSVIYYYNGTGNFFIWYVCNRRYSIIAFSLGGATSPDRECIFSGICGRL